MLGSVKYTKSTVFTAPIFQNSAPACIITPSGLSRGVFLALFGTLTQDTELEYVGIYRSAFVFRSSRLHNNTFRMHRFLLFQVLGIFGEFWGGLGDLREAPWGAPGNSGRARGSPWAAPGALGELWGALGSSGESFGAPGGLWGSSGEALDIDR